MATRHITAPAGFVAGAVAAGIKQSGKPDVAIIAAESLAIAAILTTRNQVFGEPVRWCRRILPRGSGRIRAIVINAGCSNVCTGAAGFHDAAAMAKRVAKRLGCRAEQVLVASTGIIGHRLPMRKILAGIDAAAARLGVGDDEAVVRAIMTTDLKEKSAVVHVRLGGKDITVAGIAKGSGMIAPHLATMISVITTDALVPPALLHKALREVVGGTFNAVTVDSDTSTSDTVAVLASGAAGAGPRSAASGDYRRFVKALGDVCGRLARAIAADGEGATKLVSIEVRGALGDAEAAIAAKSVADSPLVKCAIHGGDPNGGRIAAALGKSAAKVSPEKLSIRIGGVTVFARGRPKAFDIAKVRQHLRGSEVRVQARLGLGRGTFTAWTCDLSRQYIAINADYHT